MPGNVGWQGLVVILIVLLLVFGPKRLPEMGRSLGRGMREFKDSISGIGRDEDEEPEKAELTPPASQTATTAATPTSPETERVSR